jgi:CRP/FNR family transcriptional regulator, cyclic AMP receptor protein
MNTVPVDFPEGLGQLALFADLSESELESIAASCEVVSFGEGEWIIRQGDDLSALYMLLEGEVTTVIDDEDRRVLPKGSFFGEVSVLLDEPTSASIVTRTPVTCLIVPAPDVESFLISHPRVMYRILKAEARRLRTASEWAP